MMEHDSSSSDFELIPIISFSNFVPVMTSHIAMARTNGCIFSNLSLYCIFTLSLQAVSLCSMF